MDFDLGSELKDALADLIAQVDATSKADAESALDRIAMYTSTGIATGDLEGAKQNISFELSTLASLASITSSVAQRQVKDAVGAAIVKAVGVVIAAA